MNRFLIRTRSFARKTGIIRIINKIRSSDSYERRVYQALEATIKPGDVVWDVGANIGIYTELFCQWVGKDGHVVAFEPAEESYNQIRQRLHDCAWLELLNIALGDSDASGRLAISAQSVQNHLINESDTFKEDIDSIPVTICRGDSVCKQSGQVPNVVKIDVEGFEQEVLIGMGEILSSTSLRCVLVEVHYNLLEKRGMADTPILIEKLLKKNHFGTRWLDASHLLASR